jgi:aerobactin synthase
MSSFVNVDDFKTVNLRIVAKALGELCYEEVLKASAIRPSLYEVKLGGGLSYQFRAWRTVWDYLRVDASSLKRVDNGIATDRILADQFYLDARVELGMNDINFANFLDELYRTLYSDMALLERQRNFAARDFTELHDADIQSLLEGHPKALLNKGRVGWGVSDLKAYAPESGETIRLHWVAVKRERLNQSYAEEMDEHALLMNSMSRREYHKLIASVEAKNIDLKDFSLVPVHPWQWDKLLPIHFINDIQSGAIVSLGIFGDSYRAQTSLRTLINIDDAKRYHIKLPVSILNTSCIRGIDGKYIPLSPELSRVMQSITESDPVLNNTMVLGEIAGVFCQQRSYASIAGAPYRYNEMLGAIWRESPESMLEEGEKAILTATLFHRTFESKSALLLFIGKSGLTTEAWLQSYFETVVLPLYHLQLKYGIGLVSHGQNIILTMKNFRPSRLIIKDFQGDLRLLDKDIPELDVFTPELKAVLTRLPAQYLIHDLLTGHFVTVLRFMSATLQEESGYDERSFYKILARVISSYHAQHAELSERVPTLGLLSPTIPRVLVNKVRFQIGYGDSSERPLPMVGSDLINPLAESLEREDVSHARGN